jgi:uncharacterized DUF497 family protein
MKIEYDEDKRQLTLENRGLDFEDAGEIFEGFYFTKADNRKDYGETRYVTVGLLEDTVIVVVWTDRPPNRRIISMRKANENERGDYYDAMD